MSEDARDDGASGDKGVGRLEFPAGETEVEFRRQYHRYPNHCFAGHLPHTLISCISKSVNARDLQRNWGRVKSDSAQRTSHHTPPKVTEDRVTVRYVLTRPSRVQQELATKSTSRCAIRDPTWMCNHAFTLPAAGRDAACRPKRATASSQYQTYNTDQPRRKPLTFLRTSSCSVDWSNTARY